MGEQPQPPLDAKEFRRALADLKAAHAQIADNPKSYNLKECRNCNACMFCVACEDCTGCTHCTGCEQCTNCTRCDDCTGVHSSAYCVSCLHCINCKYLEHCEGCSDSTYCFGCVGLSKKDFHILNEPYERTQYFALVAKLKKALG